ncbi:putative ran guanine nucleotide release factor [Hordeum vulgare]|nr:putative ran guanine nucleotide release factor [Hordeum vulgare]
MAGESSTMRPLFGGAVSLAFPVRFQDVSNTLEVPSHQEVLIDPARDESLIFELLDLKGEVEDGGRAVWFLRDVVNEQDVGDNLVNVNSILASLYE